MTPDRKFTDNYLRFILNDISKEELIEEIVVLNTYIDTKTTARLANPHSHNRYSTMSRVQLVINDLEKAERNRIIKLISQMPELGAGVNANHMATVEQVALRDKIISEIKK